LEQPGWCPTSPVATTAAPLSDQDRIKALEETVERLGARCDALASVLHDTVISHNKLAISHNELRNKLGLTGDE
jgi:regulator of replication initiation timing